MPHPIADTVTEGEWYRIHHPHTAPGFFGSASDTEYVGGKVLSVSDDEVVLEDSTGLRRTVDLRDTPTVRGYDVVRIEEWTVDEGAWVHGSAQVVWEEGFVFG